MLVPTNTATEPDYKYITADDFTAYGAWCAPHVAAFNPMPTVPLYHYATGSGLIEIIRSGELWSTQLSCLNDATELLYPVELLHKKTQEKLKAPKTPRLEFLLQAILAGLAAPQIATEGRFVACFSEDGDDLSQWRGYGGGEGGYAIQFNSQYLRDMRNIPEQFTILGKVDYCEKRHDAFLTDVLDAVAKFFIDGMEKKRAPTMEEWTDEFLGYWASLVIMFAPFIKHPKFKGEREWRLVYHFQDEAIPRMRYLQRNSMMTKHVPLRLMLKDGRPRLPITGVVVGPSRYKDASRVSVGDLLRTHGYSDKEVPVRTTDIPYRLI
jgi:hypothetical protein